MEETRLLIDFLVLKEKPKTFFECKEINYHLNARHYGSVKAWIFLIKNCYSLVLITVEKIKMMKVVTVNTGKVCW